jgi:phenylalanyl-tRNA synthetase alpha chain
MPSIHSILTPSQLARDLEVRDLTDPTEGGHAIQRLIDAAVTSLAAGWNCQVRWHREPRVVPVEDNYDRLRIPPDAVSRDVRYTRYVDGRRMLRSHSTAMVPSALRALAAEPADDTLVVCPGVVYRRDAIDRLHAATPHQLDSSGRAGKLEDDWANNRGDQWTWRDAEGFQLASSIKLIRTPSPA